MYHRLGSYTVQMEVQAIIYSCRFRWQWLSGDLWDNKTFRVVLKTPLYNPLIPQLYFRNLYDKNKVVADILQN